MTDQIRAVQFAIKMLRAHEAVATTTLGSATILIGCRIEESDAETLPEALPSHMVFVYPNGTLSNSN